MATVEPIAHLSGDGRSQLLRDHLFGTAERAGKMADEFGCGEWGRLAGLWHDLGKYSEDFQHMIRKVGPEGTEAQEYSGRIDHSTARTSA